MGANVTLDMFDDGIKLSVTQMEYSIESDEPVINIFGRTADGESKSINVHGFRPYFYVPKDETIEDEKIIDVEDGYRAIDGTEVCKVYTKIPKDVKNLRGERSYEADIPFTTRFLIDLGIFSGISIPNKDEVSVDEIEPVDFTAPLRVCIIDIECDDRYGFPETKRDPIVCITAWDSFVRDYQTFLVSEEVIDGVNCFNDEKEMLKSLLDYIRDRDPDILTGWNFDEFDAPYLVDRMKELGIDRSNMTKGRVVFDLLDGYKHALPVEKESYRLDYVAEEELGLGKLYMDDKVHEMLEDDPRKLVNYNRRDVELCVRINEQNGIISFFKEVANFTGCPLEDTLMPSRVIDIYVLRAAKDKFVLPSKGYEKGKEFKGAIVLSPITGVKKNVIVLDLRSLYPMSMITINASPETKSEDGEYVAPNDVRFLKKPEGLARRILRDLLDERAKLKKLRDKHEYGSKEYKRYDLQQNAIKTITNAYYGVSGYRRFRLYDREIGSAITSIGRAIIEYTKDLVEQMGYEIVYGDTDSTMVSVGEDDIDLEKVIEIGRELERSINEGYDEFAKRLNVDEHWFQIKFEKVYKRFFQAGTKKRYAGHLIWKEDKTCDDWDIVGFEFKRSDQARITREVQRELIIKIISGDEFEDISGYLRSIISKFESGSLDLDEVGIPSGIGKNLDDYETEDAHIRGAIYANKHFGTRFGRGSKPKHVYVKKVPDGYPRTDVICFETARDVPEGFEVDWRVMLDKTIKAPMEKILKAMNWSWSDIETSKRQIGLGSFFHVT